MKRFAPLLVVSCLASFSAQAATLISVGASDATATDAGVVDKLGNVTVPAGRIGDVHHSAVLVFQITGIPAGNRVENASLSLEIKSAFGAPAAVHSLDLYGLSFRSDASVLGSDYYEGALDTTAGVTLIGDGIYSRGGAAAVTFSGSSLTDYINAQLAAGAGEGDYLFLRVSADQELESTSYFFVNAGSHPTNPPGLSFTTVVPEPSAAMLVSLVGVVALVRRRRA
jgi:hypothetical protein